MIILPSFSNAGRFGLSIFPLLRMGTFGPVSLPLLNATNVKPFVTTPTNAGFSALARSTVRSDARIRRARRMPAPTPSPAGVRRLGAPSVTGLTSPRICVWRGRPSRAVWHGLKRDIGCLRMSLGRDIRDGLPRPTRSRVRRRSTSIRPRCGGHFEPLPAVPLNIVRLRRIGNTPPPNGSWIEGERPALGERLCYRACQRQSARFAEPGLACGMTGPD